MQNSRCVPLLLHSEFLVLHSSFGSKNPIASDSVMRIPPRRAFTLVELLVVIAIIGILVALLLPAIQTAREAARRSQCASQMKQLALAALNFETTHHRIPGGTGYNHPNQLITPIVPDHFHGMGWIVEILPFAEEQGIHDTLAPYQQAEFGANRALNHPDLSGIVQTQLDLLMCPSDQSVRELLSEQWQWKGTQVAATNYRGVMGSNQMSQGTSSFPVVLPLQTFCNNGVARCNGMIWRTSSQWPVRLRQVTDGTSHTFMVGEDLPSHNWHTMWAFANGDSSSTYASLNYSLSDPDPATWWDMRGFRSLHPGGAHFAYADGSVHFIQEAVNFDTYQALSTIAEAEAITQP